ncbi:nectin-3-like protein isoform X2 [Hippoglossus hippoglossus]|uniref:nectin-3-like protein isoform X1 n=1 Tax=Hippoglossus hippoglossus TaxID=8267 RepID=UPI00148DAA8B|nr:nectin-3-like protein isoform X1 [Hippoglossus hippoglossus]XP_034466368.1 nectin-3-like protein isoform X1 [Hippoglossus hippoglossus]XP_034466369.1 nectin-3-like protein isoform X2 [Hippoglossus hippoglossus]XP_034466370.1 nectin-3-like protein isoform X2 [Hippoglossus hippoglossus]
MKTGSTSTLILLEMIYVTLLPALKAQTISVQPEVTGYLGHDVTLPCHFIKASANDTVIQVQWDLLGPEKKTIIVFKPESGVNIPDSPLKEKVNLTEQSLIIKDVELKNAGLYMCTLTTFPSGSLTGETKLIVREEQPLSSVVVSAIVIAVILLVGIMAAITYFIFIRRCDSSVSHSVVIDTGWTAMDVSKSSGIERAEDVVYSGVKVKPPRGETTSSNDEHRMPSNADVTYAEVTVLGRKPK